MNVLKTLRCIKEHKNYESVIHDALREKVFRLIEVIKTIKFFNLYIYRKGKTNILYYFNR